jgi:hypothetical protein
MTTFLVIGACGLVVLVLSLLVGELLEGVLDGVGGDWFSTEVVGAFVAALGFGGALAEAQGLPLPVATGVGVGAGVVFGAFAAWLTRLVRSGGTEATPSTEDVLGWDARVVSPIPLDGLGVVTVRRGGHLLRFNARAEQALPTGAEVHVTGVLSPTAVTVAPLWPDTLEQQLGAPEET